MNHCLEDIEEINGEELELLKEVVMKFLTHEDCTPYQARDLKKRTRQTFTKDQILLLEMEYRKTKYISRDRRRYLMETLMMSERQIKVWFQNRRTKEKKSKNGIPTDIQSHLSYSDVNTSQRYMYDEGNFTRGISDSSLLDTRWNTITRDKERYTDWKLSDEE